MATAAQIQQLYIAYFGRPADPNGLASWLIPESRTQASIAQSFGTAPEFTTAFAGQTYAQQVNNLYLNLFGRSADPTGLNGWVSLLNSGALTLAQAGLAISNGALGSDKVALDSKTTASGQWTASSNGSTAGILAYSGDPGISAGRSFLLPVLTTATIPTQAATDTQVQTLITSNPSAGLTFNQITNNAVLTSGTNNNGTNTAPGFTPAGSFLDGSNNIIKPGALVGATIVDSGLNDTDTLLLDQGFFQSALSVNGVEAVSFVTTGGGFDAGSIAGVKNINFSVGSTFRGGANGASTAIINLSTTATVGFGSALQLGGVNNILLNAANDGILSLGGTTALTITNTLSSNISYTLRQNSAVGSFNFFAGSANTAFTLSLDATAANGVAYSAGSVSGGGSFTLNFGTANGFGSLASNSASVFSFGNTGTTVVNYRAALGGNGVLNNLSVSGVDFYQIATTAGGISTSFDAQVQLKNGAISLGFGTAQSTTAIIFGNALNTFVNTGNLITIGTITTAFKASGSTDTVSLSFNTLSGTFNLSGAGFVLGTDTNTALTANAGIEVLNLNIYSTTAVTANHNIQAITVATGTTTFNLNAAQSVSFSISAFTAVGSGLTTLGFSQADGNNTVFVSSAWTQSRLSFFDGSGNSTITLNNLFSAQSHTATTFTFANYSQISTQINTINISDGGLDVISLGGDSALLGFGRANIIGIGVGDVLSFTNYSGSLNSVGVLTTAGLTAATLSGINLWFDGTDTFVMQTTGSGITAGINFVAAIISGNFASIGRWTLNSNNLVLAN